MNAESLTRALGGRWLGAYGMACCPAHDDKAPSLSIRDGHSALLLHCHAGCACRDIVAAIETLLSQSVRCAVREISPIVGTDDLRTRMIVETIWAECRPIKGTLAEDYLRERAILGPLAPTLRFHPRLRHPSGCRLPAMVARVQFVGSEKVGLHRTFLDPERPAKTALQPAKAMLGHCAGGSVRLSSGSQALLVAEGLETSLSLCDALGNDFATWASLSTAGMSKLVLPEPRTFNASLIVALDGDRAGHAAGQRLAARARAAGWMVEMISAPDGLDFNDVAQGLAHV